MIVTRACELGQKPATREAKLARKGGSKTRLHVPIGLVTGSGLGAWVLPAVESAREKRYSAGLRLSIDLGKGPELPCPCPALPGCQAPSLPPLQRFAECGCFKSSRTA